MEGSKGPKLTTGNPLFTVTDVITARRSLTFDPLALAQKRTLNIYSRMKFS